MLINRPCLCLMEGRIPNESPTSKEFNKTAAATCVSSARAIIHLIVDESNLSKLIRNSPWWCLVHYLMSAKAIIMLEMVYQAIHMPEDKAALFAESKMVLGWLKSVSRMNMTYRRFSVELADQLKKVAPRVEEHFEEYEVVSNTPPSTTDGTYLPFQSWGYTGNREWSFEIPEKFEDKDQPPYLDLTSPMLSWWSSADSDRDLVMADAPRGDPYSCLPSNQPVDISLWLHGKEGD